MSENLTNAESSPSHQNNIEYSSEAELMSEFHRYMSDYTNFEAATNYLYESLLDDAILGVVFEVHHAVKTGALEAIEGQPEDNKQFRIVDIPDFEIFSSSNAKKSINITCPNCNRVVATSRFAPHLENCMGLGRNSSRIASQRLASTREGTTNYCISNMSDDEDDADWSSEKRKKKLQTVRNTGSKNNGKSS